MRLAFVVALPACGAGTENDVQLDGLDDAERATAMARWYCQRLLDCGLAEGTCNGECHTIDPSADWDDCVDTYAGRFADRLADLGKLSEADVEALETCLDDLSALPCRPEEPVELPASCDPFWDALFGGPKPQPVGEEP